MTNPIRSTTAHIPMKAQPRERRRSVVGRALWAWFIDTDLDTVEKALVTAQIVFSIAVLVLNVRLISVPPPVIQGWALALPAPLWFGVMLGLAGWSIQARAARDFCGRQRAMCASGIVCGALCNPLLFRAPTVLVLVLPCVAVQVVTASRLKRLCVESKSDRQGQ